MAFTCWLYFFFFVEVGVVAFGLALVRGITVYGKLEYTLFYFFDIFKTLLFIIIKSITYNICLCYM